MINNGHPDAEFTPDVRPRLEEQECLVVNGDAGSSVAHTSLRQLTCAEAGLPPCPGTAILSPPISPTRWAPRRKPR